MPIYEYRCSRCRRRSSLFVRSYAAPEQIACQHCGNDGATRVFSTFAIVRSEDRRLEGCARVMQWRDKRDKGYVLPLAREMAELCRERGALFIVNDHVDVAILAEADGVHLGQHDLPPAEARRLLPAEATIGGSTALLGEALAARDEGADYIAVGAMFATNSKQRTRPAGLETLRRVRAAVSDRPLVAIG